ncbi:latent-transforming growth factor beta-binding protein 4-like [Amphibalanus amphitrite]|uniref:latent-transforming growth factor beta-binding protein 4-like n=1 Tax=Amphibalanus amphitrite TaxID=1232801 RepID=UPI001C9138F8|nr:latent-transforming growth factor beta-binding protein 4-like [Amphibalanus amphitrite]
MGATVGVWVATLLLVAATVSAATLEGSDASDPCEHHTCPSGEECVSHEVSCRRQPCPRISECRAANCTLPCRDGYECDREPCNQPPCDTRERCVPRPDACGGRCLPDELCLTKVRPCAPRAPSDARPPCVESWCVTRGAALTARHQPPPPSFCGDCPAPAVCVPTQVCRQYNECLFLPVCLTDCTEMWCGSGHECRMQPPADCETANCPPEPTCVPDGSPPEVELANRFSSGPRRPQCVVSCSDDEECRFMPTRCLEPPCPTVARCVPRAAVAAAAASVAGAAAAAAGPPPPGGECPLDDLRQLASPAFCGTASLHQCAVDGECGPQRRCCERGCGRSCLPTCQPGCAPGSECRLVAVQCIGSPCPKVAQCVAAEHPEQAGPLPPPAPSPPLRPARPFPPPSPSADQLPNGAASAAAGASSSSASASASSSQSSVDGQQSLPDRPGLCPVNDRQTQSKICFDNGSVDMCSSDHSCPAGQRCCLRGCQRLCRPVCDSCPAALQCRLDTGRPECLTPIESNNRFNIRRRVQRG